jgi:hypothetical protein
MGKRFSTIVVVLFVLSFLFANLNDASAAGLPGPTISPLSGDAVFSTEVIAQAKLPGTTNYGSLIVPVGFPAGEKQFEGDGITLSGLGYGYVNACFALSGAAQGWGGQVGYWDGKAWKLQPTTLSTPQEASYTLACAKVYENGTYALIKWVSNTALLPDNNKPVCTFSIDDFSIVPYGDIISGDGYTYFPTIGEFLIISGSDLAGKQVTIKFVHSDPTHGFLFNGKTSNVTVANNTIGTTMFPNYFVVDAVPDLDGTFNYSLGIVNIYFRLDFGDCILNIMIDTGNK